MVHECLPDPVRELFRIFQTEGYSMRENVQSTSKTAGDGQRETIPVGQQWQDQITAAVAQIAERRGVIERAKGMLMLIYTLDEDAAFELIKWRSQETNVKLSTIAAQIVEDFAAVPRDSSMPSHAVYDDLLLTAHTRAARRA